MKNFKTVITIFAISLSTVFAASASEKNKVTDQKTLRTEIVSLLGKNIPMNIDKSYLAEVQFIVNNNNEVVVISVDSKTPEFISYVKNKLNYKKVNLKNIKKGEIYRMPIKVNKK